VSVTPESRLAAASRLLDQATPETVGLWGRATALLARQALEQAVTARLARRHPVHPDTGYTAQLHALHAVVPTPVAHRGAYLWSALSRATHHASYELPPTQAALRAWLTDVAEIVAALDPGPTP